MATPRAKREKIFEGSNKIIYKGDEEFTLIQFFKDELQENHDSPTKTISGKGVINNTISEYIMRQLDNIAIDNHFIERLNMREQLIQMVDLIPVQVTVSNLAAGKISRNFGIEEGTVFEKPVIDFSIKNSKLGYPSVNEEQIIAFNWSDREELAKVKQLALRINDFLTGLFLGIGIRLVDIRMEFGRVFSADEMVIMLADEISPDTCRLWDIETNEKFGFEHALSDDDNPGKNYQEIAKRLKLKL